MAEQVQLHVEAKLPILGAFLKEKLLSEDRTKEIIRKITKFEYRIKRRGAILTDFTDYISFQKHVEQEFAEQGRLLNKTKRCNKLCGLVTRDILGTYQRALVKFSHNVALWEEFLFFAMSTGSRNVFKKSAKRVLMLHPKISTFWILVANWEWNYMGSIENARAVYMNSLRMNPSNPDLYCSFFKLELEFLAKLVERKAILGLSLEVTADDEIMSGKLALIVFQSAIENNAISATSFGDFIQTSARLLQIQDFTANLIQMAAPVFANDTDAVKLAFKSILSIELSEEKQPLRYAMSLLDCCIKHVTLEKSLLPTVQLLRELANESFVEDKEAKSAIYGKIGQLFQLAEEQNILNSRDYCLWLSMASDIEYSPNQAFELTERAKAKFPKDTQLLALLWQTKVACLQGDQLADELVKMLKSSSSELVKTMTNSNFWAILTAETFWIHNLKTALTIVTSALCNPEIELPSELTEIFTKVHRLLGSRALRTLCENITSKRIVKVDFYASWLRVELLSSAEVSTVRQLFDRIIYLYPNDTQIIDICIEFERREKNYAKASQLLLRRQAIVNSN